MAKLRDSQFKTGDILITEKSVAVSHCGIVIQTRDVAHATSKGMKVEDVINWSALSRVYRPKNLMPGMADRLDKIAKRMAEEDTKTEYGKSRAFFGSWTGTGTYGESAKQRLITYRLRLSLKGDHAIVKNVYCSEFVVLCYQLACEDDNSRHFIKLDAKHTLPKNLRAYLDNDKAYWELAGEWSN
jgi:hypothetical protein